MRRIFGIWLLMLPMVLMAAPVSQEQAMQRAREFLNKRPQMAQGGKLKAARAPLKLQSAQATASYYVFNVGEQQGFVIASGDDRTPAILGYADDGSFDADNIPTNMQAWLEDYERQISLLDKYPAAQASSTIREAIDPLITSKWNQDSPYSDLCPIDPQNGKQSATGCAATAMAQIMNYHKYPDATTAEIPAYQTGRCGIYMDAIPANTPIDWDNILATYDENATEAQRQAVAQLMLFCGCSVQMDYAFGGSGSLPYLVAWGLYNYFGYDKNILFKYKSMHSTVEWENIVYHELAEQRPVFHTGVSMEGGHAFVVDGYDGDGLFHVNWGWGGTYNGYFLLNILDEKTEGPEATISEKSYSCDQHIVTGIQKPVDTGTADAKIALTSYYMYIKSDKKEFQRRADGTFSIPVYLNVFSESMINRLYDIGLGIFNAQDERVCDTLLTTARDIGPLQTLSTTSDLTLPADLPDGNYTIRIINKPTGTDKWLLGYGNFDVNIKCTIQGDVLKARDVTNIYISGTIESLTEQPTVGSKVHLVAKVTNHLVNFIQQYYFKVDDKIIGGMSLDLESGETKSVNLNYVPTRSGANVLKLVIIDNDIEYLVAQETINVQGSETPELLFDLGIKDQDENAAVPHTDIDAIVNIHNNCRYAYNDNIGLEVFKQQPDGTLEMAWIQEIPITLEGDSDSLLQVPIEGLENMCNYYLVAYYHDADGKYQCHNNEMHFFITNKSDVLPVGLTLPPSSTTDRTTIYDLSGRRVSNPTHGLYIVGRQKRFIK